MKINSNTKISEIIKENDEAIDTIASINKHFLKLKNPILRKVLASRVTIADAAKIGGVSSEDLLERLSKIGFVIQKSASSSTTNKNMSDKDFTDKEIIDFDARPELEKGIDPFKSIMREIKALPDGKILKVVNTFEPLPLINMLSEKGYAFKVERKDGLVYTFFTKSDKNISNKDLPQELIEDNSKLFDEIEKTFEGKINYVDVRQLEMPLPMVTILQEIEDLPTGNVLYVHHKRIPQFLLSELEERGYNLVGKKIDEANTKLLIYKK